MGYESLGLVAELWRVKLEQQSTVGDKIYLSMHPRNFGFNKTVCTYLCPPLHVSGCGNLSLMWYWTFSYGQLTAVKIKYLLTSIKWLYRGLRCSTRWGDVFFEVLRWPRSYWFSIDRRLRFIFPVCGQLIVLHKYLDFRGVTRTSSEVRGILFAPPPPPPKKKTSLIKNLVML